MVGGRPMKRITYDLKYCGRAPELPPASRSHGYGALVAGGISLFAVVGWAITPTFATAPTPTIADREKNGIRDCTDDLVELHVHKLVAEDQLSAQRVCFTKYVSSFDLRRDNIDEDDSRPLAIPRWVMQRVDANSKATGQSPEGRKRPTGWFTIPELADQGLAPRDASYRFSQTFRNNHRNWYERGHLAQKYLAEREPVDPMVKVEGAGAGWFTHNVANAVPQRARFNKGPWLTLECYTGAWANRYRSVWILSGPIFLNARPREWLVSNADSKSIPVAIPDALFKVVFREDEKKNVKALAFIYPQDADAYAKGPWDPTKWLTSIAQVQKLTGIDILPHAAATTVEDEIPSKIWSVNRIDFDPSCRRFAPRKS